MSTTLPACGPVDRRSLRFGPVLTTLLVAMPVAVALCWHSAAVVWETGDFANTDDAMRAVQIRDWMAGQAWFDLSAHRFGLPSGVVSHWSRVVDVPISTLIRLFGLALPSDSAERAARIAYPVALQAALVAAMGYAARVLAGAGAIAPAGLVTVLAGIGCMQFEPGRIHHHAPQIVLLTLMTAASLDALDSGRARRGVLVGVSVALSLAIGLENLPFVAVMLVVPPLAWAVAVDRQRGALLWFAGGLGLAAPVLFAATVAPSRYGMTAVDALSLMHVTVLVEGAALLVLAALWTPRTASVLFRLAVLVAIGAILGATLVVLFPEGLRGPYSGVDPLLRAFWLDEVQEAAPLVKMSGEAPGTVAILMVPIMIGSLLALVACVCSRGLDRARWAVLIALQVVGFVGVLWEVRVAYSLQPVALLGGAWAVGRLWETAHRDGRVTGLLRPAAVLALCSSFAWALLPWPAAAIVGSGQAEACFSATALAPLATLPPGLAFAPIDSGPFILAHTGLSVLAGPYHRDNAGNRAAIEGFLASPDSARAAVRATGARYVVVCGHQTDLEIAAAPEGLAAALDAGRVPAWLDPIALGETPFRVYAVR